MSDTRVQPFASVPTTHYYRSVTEVRPNWALESENSQKPSAGLTVSDTFTAPSSPYSDFGTFGAGDDELQGQLMHGLVHPEMGHMRIPHDLTVDPYPGFCSFHGDCWEGLASGRAMSDRWGIDATDLPTDHHGWDLEAHYLGVGIANIVCTLSPQRIILGGGVTSQSKLIPMVRDQVASVLNCYVAAPQVLIDMDRYIVRTPFGGDAGVLGAIALAIRAAERVS